MVCDNKVPPRTDLPCLQYFGLYKYKEDKKDSRKLWPLYLIGVPLLVLSVICIVMYWKYSLFVPENELQPEDYHTSNVTTADDIEIESSTTEKNQPNDINAEMLIAIPDRVPSQFLVPPPFPPPLSILIKRRPSPAVASRRYYEDPRPFQYSRKKSKPPVNSIQDILNQMERESHDYERTVYKKPKRINFYGKYRHRPNRPQVIPIPYESAVPIRESKPSVANEVNHHLNHPTLLRNQVPQREPTQLFYPNPNNADTTPQLNNGLYDQIIATNKQRQETAKDAKPFSLMLDIYPMGEDQKNQTTTPQPQLAPQAIDHSYYNSIKFHQIHANPILQYPPATTIAPDEQPGKIMVHLNLYPTKKGGKASSNLFDPDPKFDLNSDEDDGFMPIVNPQIYYRSRSAEDESNQAVLRDLANNGNVVEIPPRRKLQPPHPYVRTGIPRVQVLKSIELGPAINITDYRPTLPPQVINKFIYDEGYPRYTYLGQFNSNEIGRRADTELPSPSSVNTELSTKAPAIVYQRNSHQPDNPMVVENLHRYLRSAIAEEPSRKAISS